METSQNRDGGSISPAESNNEPYPSEPSNLNRLGEGVKDKVQITKFGRPVYPNLPTIRPVPALPDMYRTLQRQLLEAEHSGCPDCSACAVKRQLIEQFEKAFNLKIVPGDKRGHEARRLLDKIFKREWDWCDYDHLSYGTREGFGGQILISQPYGVATEIHLRLAAKWGYEFLQTNEWSFYVPGTSCLFVVSVPVESIQRLKKAEKKGDLN